MTSVNSSKVSIFLETSGNKQFAHFLFCSLLPASNGWVNLYSSCSSYLILDPDAWIKKMLELLIATFLPSILVNKLNLLYFKRKKYVLLYEASLLLSVLLTVWLYVFFINALEKKFSCHLYILHWVLSRYKSPGIRLAKK